MNNAMVENPIRKKIRFFITKDPGIRFQDLMEITGSSESTLRYHLKWMMKRGELDLKKIDGENKVFPKDDFDHVTESKPEKRVNKFIIQILTKNPGISVKELIINDYFQKKEMRKQIKKLIAEKKIIEYVDQRDHRKKIILTDDFFRLRFRELVHDLVSKKIDEKQFMDLKRELDLICDK